MKGAICFSGIAASSIGEKEMTLTLHNSNLGILAAFQHTLNKVEAIMSDGTNISFEELAKQIHLSGEPIRLSPKQLLSYFGATRRRSNIIWRIDQALTNHELTAVPS
jgi:hypothetical protein